MCESMEINVFLKCFLTDEDVSVLHYEEREFPHFIKRKVGDLYGYVCALGAGRLIMDTLELLKRLPWARALWLHLCVRNLDTS
ncbi:Casp8-Associated Protein 2 [Manis pentadactyla]|nr:Casp8-Associated Protein 2 [Manis pentadactyla]